MSRPNGERISHATTHGEIVRQEMFNKMRAMAALSVEATTTLQEGIRGSLSPSEIGSIRTRIQRSAYPRNEDIRYSGKLNKIREEIAALRSSGILRTRLEKQKDAIILDTLTRD